MTRLQLGARASRSLDAVVLADTADQGAGAVVSGKFFIPPDINVVTTATAAGTVSTIKMLPIRILQAASCKSLSVRVTTAVASSAFGIALYKAGSNGLPTGAPIVSSNSLAGTTAGIVTLTANFSLTPGLYWMAVNMNTAGIVFTGIPSGTTNAGVSAGFIGTSTALNIFSGLYYAISGTITLATGFPTNPTLVESTNASTFVPLPIFQAA